MQSSSVFLISAALALSAGAAAASDDHAPTTLQFALSDGNTIAGYLYGTSADRPLLILVHGASDSHTVFDFAAGFRPAPELAQRGFGVLTIDRVGYGASSHPDGDTLDEGTQAAQLHDVIQAVRGGALGFTPPAIVVLGPSVGADITIIEAGTYHDVDGVIVCFNTNQLQPALFAVDVNAWFAQGDYFDFGSDFRAQFFYAQPWALDWVIALDNATRSLVPRGEIASALRSEAAPYRGAIAAPVLLMQAAEDHLFVPEDDSALFSSSPDVSFVLLPHTGHKAFSHPTSEEPAVHAIADWLDTRF